MFLLFYLLIIEQILQGLYNLWDGLGWLRLAQRRAGTHSGFYAPRLALFCPVKGAEPGLEQNIFSLISFDYPDYEIFFAMASADDPARKIIERVTAASKHKVHIVIAGRPSDCGEKVNNLRVAISKATEGFDVYVFADSDGRPGRSWLQRLVAPLSDSNLGAVHGVSLAFPRKPADFGARWLRRGTRPSRLTLGDHHKNFCWGGGTAIRRERFEQCQALDFWTGSVSDDFSLFDPRAAPFRPSHSVRSGVHSEHHVRLRWSAASWNSPTAKLLLRACTNRNCGAWADSRTPSIAPQS